MENSNALVHGTVGAIGQRHAVNATGAGNCRGVATVKDLLQRCGVRHVIIL